MATDAPPLDVERLLAVLERHQVEYLLVGGVAAIAHGASRPTVDFDCLARRTRGNLTRLAAAMNELNARLRVGGLTDAEAVALRVPLDADMLGRMEISTWRTNAGDFDVLTDIPDAAGRRSTFDDLVGRSSVQDVNGVAVRVAALEDVIASKEWADRPKDHEALPGVVSVEGRGSASGLTAAVRLGRAVQINAGSSSPRARRACPRRLRRPSRGGLGRLVVATVLSPPAPSASSTASWSAPGSPV